MLKDLCIALGDFDGVHIGHLNVILAAVNNKSGYTPAVYTFSDNCKGSDIITDNMTKQNLLYKLGIKHIFSDDFKNVKDLSPAQFVNEILKERLCAKEVVCGEDFLFGKDASGNVETLIELCSQYDIRVSPVKQVNFSHKKVSSSDIRKYISCGDIEKANKMLGHSFSVTGTVIQGKRFGHTNDVPTINIMFKAKMVIPAYGVYITQTIIGGKRYNSISNVGIRPSVEKTNMPNIETNIFCFEGDLYGKPVTIEFIKMIRKEHKFENKNMLYEQINSDIEKAKEYFGGE